MVAALADGTADVAVEAAVASDTPYWRDNLRALEDEASEMQRLCGPPAQGVAGI